MTKSTSTYLYSALVLGALSIAVQTVFLRELFAVYGFSEILLALLLFFWLSWGAIGSFTFKRGDFENSLIIFSAAGVIVPLIVRITAIKLRPVFGMTTPFWDILLAGFICSAPTFFAGRTFAALAKEKSPARLYAAEGIGALVGGIFSAIMLTIAPPRIALSVLIFIAITPLIFKSQKRFIAFIVLLATAYLSDTFLIPPVDSALWKGFWTQEIESPYGRISLLTRAGENYIYENGLLVGASADSLSSEQIVHPVMWAHSAPKNILLVGGAFSGAIRDIEKHDVSQIIVPFPDKRLLTAGFASLPALRNSISSGIVDFVPSEARKILLGSADKFDVIFLIKNFPATGADNRFWTAEFFRDVKNALADSGIFAAALPVGANFLSEYQTEMVASIWRTAKSIFPDAEIYFLDSAVLIVSLRNGKLHLRQRLLNGELRPVQTATVPIAYLPILFQEQRSATLERQLNSAKFVRINHDWRPLAYMWGIFQQASLADVQIPTSFAAIGKILVLLGIIALIIFAAISLIFGKLSPIMLLLAGGFWGMSSQSFFLLLFQANFGNLYYLVGAAVGTFLFGSAVGSILGEELRSKWCIMLLIAIFIAITAFVVIGNEGAQIHIAIFFIIFALSGMVSGIIFGTASSIGISGGKAYSADLAGAAAGAIIATIAIPTIAPVTIVLVIAAAVVLLFVIAIFKQQ